ncbi:hypothetical protein L195_g061203, partial [Trifolium pratense]
KETEVCDPTEDSLETDTDDQTIAKRLRRGKIAHVVKGMSSKTTTKPDCEIGYTIPLQTIHLEQTDQNPNSSSDTNTEELARSTDEVISAGESLIAKNTSANKP